MPDTLTLESQSAGATDLGPAAPTQLLRIPGNVGPSTGNVDAPSGVHVAGNVVDLHTLSAAGPVTVDGIIEAATVTAVAADLAALGGIAGKQAAVVTAGRSVTARYIRQARVEAGADVSVQTEISSARVVAGGDIRAAGDLLGGHLTAAGSVACHSAGSPAGTPTVVEAGTDEFLRRAAAERLPEINRARDKAAKIRQTAGPLMRNPKLLTPAQKEQATEMLFDADAAEEVVERQLAHLCTLYSRSVARPPATIVVHGTLHPGVTLRIGGYETRITATLPGPIGIRLRPTPGRQAFQIVSCADKASLLLPATPTLDPVMDQLKKEVAQRV